MDKKTQVPKIFLILRFVALGLFVVGVTLVVLACTAFATYDDFFGLEPSFGCLIPGVIMVFFSIPCLMISLTPVFHKVSVKTAKYLQESNREDLEDIATTSAEIGAEATTITAKAMATGLKEGFKDTKFCKHCGSEIDRDSKFCSECGGQQ